MCAERIVLGNGALLFALLCSHWFRSSAWSWTDADADCAWMAFWMRIATLCVPLIQAWPTRMPDVCSWVLTMCVEADSLRVWLMCGVSGSQRVIFVGNLPGHRFAGVVDDTCGCWDHLVT